MRVAIYAICGSEARHAQEWLETCRDADQIWVTMCGSNDTTACRLIAGGAQVNQAHVVPFRFDDARNAALAQVPVEFDVCISLDLDERLSPGWRKALEAKWVPGVTNKASVWWDGRNGYDRFMQDMRVHSRTGWRWKYPCHEITVRSMERSINIVNIPEIEILHAAEPRPKASREQYLNQLAWGEFENPTDPRCVFYYGRELVFRGFAKEGLDKLNQYLAMNSNHPAEIVEAKRHIKTAEQMLQRPKPKGKRIDGRVEAARRRVLEEARTKLLGSTV